MEKLITISIIGLIAGFVFSMPIAGPISIMITSNALKGRMKYCNLFAVGASLSEFFYVLISVYGAAKIISAFKEITPYFLGIGALFVLFTGIRLARTELDLGRMDEGQELADRQDEKHRGAIYTGFMINFLNPTLFIGWLISSFIILSFAASLGFDTGGLENVVDENLETIGKIEGNTVEKPQIPSYLQFDTLEMLKKNSRKVNSVKISPVSHLLMSVVYSFFLSAGSVLWSVLLTFLIVRFRNKIKIDFLNWFIRGMGIILCFFAIFFGYSAVKILLHVHS